MKNTITLNNGVEMPLVGYGVFQVPPAEMAAIRTLDLGHGAIVNFSDPAAMLGLFEIIRQYKV